VKKNLLREARATKVEKYHGSTNWSISCASNYVKKSGERKKERKRKREEKRRGLSSSE
jgi:hypothetical protein